MISNLRDLYQKVIFFRSLNYFLMPFRLETDVYKLQLKKMVERFPLGNKWKWQMQFKYWGVHVRNSFSVEPPELFNSVSLDRNVMPLLYNLIYIKKEISWQLIRSLTLLEVGRSLLFIFFYIKILLCNYSKYGFMIGR